MLIDKILKLILVKVKKSIRNRHLNKGHVDIKCPNCNEWFSISGVEKNHIVVNMPEFGSHVKCGKCGEESFWNAVAAPIPLRCDSKGNVL